MQIKQLEYLVEISRRNSFNSASEHLYITPQSLSRSISGLEDELGFKIFERSSRGVRFTREGEKFLEAAKDITKRYYQAIEEIDAYQQRAQEICSGKLFVYAHSVLTMSVLPSMISAFCKEYPYIDVSLLEGDSSSITNKLIVNDGEKMANLGILTIPKNDDDMQKYYKNQKGYHFLPLTQGEYICCVSKNSELASKRNISLKTVSQYPLVRFINSFGDTSAVQSHFFKPYGEPRTGFSTTSIGSWISAIENNVGIGIINNIVLSDASAIRDKFEKVVTLSIREKTALEVGLLVPAESACYVEIFIQFILKAFEKI